MKQFILFLLVMVFAVSCGDDHKGTVEKIKFKSEKEKLSYSLGVNQAELYFNKANLSPEDFNQNKVIEGFSKELKADFETDSACIETVQLFLGNGQQEINDRYSVEGSYCIGKMNAQNFMRIWNKPGAIEKLDLEFVKRGFKDVVQKKPLSLTKADRSLLIKNFYEKLVEDLTKVMLDTVLVNKNVQKIDNEILIETIQEGNGTLPSDSSDVAIDFILTTPYGDTMENSFKRSAEKKEPVFNVQQMYEGWSLAFPKLKQGGTYRVYIPFEMHKDPRLPFPYIIYYVKLNNVGPKGSLLKTEKSENSMSKRINPIN
jgi:FKBP-type peptidyl-prolyl cis-trans isomerase